MSNERPKLGVELTKTKVCKHSVRYDNKDSDVVKAIYIMNEGISQLNQPNNIKIAIESAD